jgi:hypothetical protein
MFLPHKGMYATPERPRALTSWRSVRPQLEHKGVGGGALGDEGQSVGA